MPNAFWQRIALFALATLLLVACAQLPKQAFNRDANADIKTVGVLRPAASGEYLVQNFGHPGLGFGLIGGLIAGADMTSKTNTFTESVKGKRFDASDEFTRLLAAEIAAAGYEVRIIDAKRPKPSLLESYEGLDESVDAYLDPVLNWVGYFTASAVSDYLPAVRVASRMVKRKSKDIVYTEMISYGYTMRGAEVVNIAADGKYRFGNFDALTQDPDKAIEGIRLGLPAIAKQIAADLKRKP